MRPRILYLLLLGLIGCGARSNVNDAREDGAQGDLRRDVPIDTQRVRDQGKKDTKPLWPDLPQRDHWIGPDTYAPPAPFGCQTDSDCFGVKCCPTPWSVKLCRNVCDQP
jgi:hypothetical protein